MGNSQSSNFSTSLNEKGNDFLENFSKKRKLEEVKSSLSQINHSFTDPRTPVWLDSDVGHDDSFAIILAGHSPKLNLLGISTVHGNQTVENTTLNTLKIVSISGLQHIDVVKGQAKPLIEPSRICPEIHGATGLDCTTEFPPITKKVVNEKAINHMFKVISEFPKPVTLVATGCLTNIALLFLVYPEVLCNIEKLVLLGGAMGVGNISPAAEFNMLVDPEAAKIVFESGVPLYMVPLEVSHSVLVTPQVIDKINQLNSPFAALMIDLLTFFAKSYKDVFRFEYPPLHDPLAVAYCIDPSIFEMELMRVDIETSSPLCRGRTVCDIFHFSGKPKNVFVGQKVKVEAFWKLLLDALISANKVSCLNKTPFDEVLQKH